MRLPVMLAIALGAAPGCGGGDAPPASADAGPVGPDAMRPPECTTTAPTECPSPTPGYADVQPIFAERCVVCHGMVEGRWPLDTYHHIVDWAPDIRAAMLDCSMPPADAGVPMTVEERQQILEWIRCGAPE